MRGGDLQPSSSHGTDQPVTDILRHSKYIHAFADLAKNRCDFDPFTPEGYCCAGSGIFSLTVSYGCFINSCGARLNIAGVGQED